jgi:hypothetical protein
MICQAADRRTVAGAADADAGLLQVSRSVGFGLSDTDGDESGPEERVLERGVSGIEGVSR